jgi:hypothetical protein
VVPTLLWFLSFTSVGMLNLYNKMNLIAFGVVQFILSKVRKEACVEEGLI